MNHILKIFYIAFVCFFIFAAISPVYGQQKKDTINNMQIEVVNEVGNPIDGARISSSRNRHIYNVDPQGKVSIPWKADDVIKVMADGYETIVTVNSQINDGKVALRPTVHGMGEEANLYTLFGETTERRTVGAYSKVDGRELEANPTMHFMNALGGRLNGLFTMDNTLVPGFTTSTSYIRSPQGNYIVLVDGVERTLDYVEAEAIESVELLKDASLKSLYGGIQANGILMIKTRRGHKFENSARVNIQTGIQEPTRLPEYLNSYDYATMYNQAAANSGQGPYFSNPEAYVNGDPILYPNVDYYGMFLNDQMNITRTNMQFTGGNNSTRFFTHLGYQTNGGLEKYTDYPNTDRVFTLRGNVDNSLLDFMTFSAGFNAALQNKSWPNLSTQDFFNMLSDNRPNEFPIFIPGSNVGKPDTEFVLGGTADNQKNPYGYLTRRGYGEREYSYIQSDFALNVDLSKWVKGLSVKPSVTLDIYNVLTATQGGEFATYQPIPPVNPGDPITYKTWGEDTQATSKSRTGNNSQRNYAFNVTATYNRSFGKHDINALLVYFQQTKEYSALHNSLKRLNVGGLLNYMYDNKYTAEVSLNRVGVSSFAPDKQFGTFPTFGAGWIISDESFMKGASWLNYLKLRGSYGILGSTSYTADGLFVNYLYRDVWELGGTYSVSGFNNIARETQTGNPNVGFQKSYELNAGIDFQLLNRSLSVSVGYYNMTLDGVLANMTDMTPGISGKGAALMMQNYKKYRSMGFEAEISYQKKFKDWNIMVGGNICSGKTDVLKEADPQYPESFAGLQKVKRIGDIVGQKIIGTFSETSEINGAPQQMYGVVRPGDLRYADTNGDNSIDNKDQVVIGNSMPSLEYGITIKLAYKGFNLDMLGYGLAGFDRVLSSKYYQIYGARKYSNVLVDGLPNGNPHPVLRTEYTNNNFISSDYWIVDGSFFKLRNIEFGYTLPLALTSKIGINQVKVFMRGANLFTISKIKDLDPESLDAGISNFPLCRTITGGLSVSF